MKRLFAVLAISSMAVAAYGQTHAEVPDAPEAPMMQTTPLGPLTGITGALTDGPLPGGDFCDTYCIRIVDPTSWAVSAVSPTGFDTQLWLFRMDGTGVVHNDDASGLLSALGPGAAPAGPAVAAGDYMLAISGYDYDPVNGAGAEIWADSPFGDETAPDGPGAGSPIVSRWVSAAGFSPAFGAYSLSLRGIEGCVPEPTTLALLGMGVLALIRRR